jgi:hypothetical protein
LPSHVASLPPHGEYRADVTSPLCRDKTRVSVVFSEPPPPSFVDFDIAKTWTAPSLHPTATLG